MSRYVVEFQRTWDFSCIAMFSSNSFFTEINVGGCKLAGIGGRGGPRNLPQFFPSEIDLGGCKLSRESLSLRAELSSVFVR